MPGWRIRGVRGSDLRGMSRINSLSPRCPSASGARLLGARSHKGGQARRTVAAPANIHRSRRPSADRARLLSANVCPRTTRETAFQVAICNVRNMLAAHRRAETRTRRGQTSDASEEADAARRVRIRRPCAPRRPIASASRQPSVIDARLFLLRCAPPCIPVFFRVASVCYQPVSGKQTSSAPMRPTFC